MLTSIISVYSGLDSHLACELWERLDHVSLSYNNFMLHGETLKFAVPPGWHPLAKNSQNLRSTSWVVLGGSGQSPWSCISKYKTCHFLFPLVGGVTIVKYYNWNIFKGIPLSNFGLCLCEWQQIKISRRMIKICSGTTDMPLARHAKNSNP